MFPPSLLEAIPGVLSVAAPVGTTSALVFDSPHSGVELPADFHPAVNREIVLLATDTYVDELFEAAPSVGAPLLMAHFPRSFLDVNRSDEDVDLEMVAGNWPRRIRESTSAKRGMGLAWRFAWGDTHMHNGPISVAELEARIDTYWHPYHARIEGLLNNAHKLHGHVYHINCHSMPAIGHALSPDPVGTVRADIVVGDYDGQSAEPGFVVAIVECLKQMGYSVSINVPFRGAELVSRYADPAQGRHSIQIEVNRRLYMNESTREKNQGFAELKANMSTICRVASDYVATLSH
ncbi:N-formylglutamate amidohydrolase [Agrobacterium tumefaciens]|uniref:N-formylglutamate amidohydrolase n=1 Tax=Agrobacterium tumefaciens TaxID=358 RepID=UPI001574CB2F|nr:N-formylglutamate amidohydrolase [Agrobacterium tumefaciens]